MSKFINPELALRRLADPSTKTVVIDEETSGLNWRRCFTVGHVLTFGPAPDDTYYIPIRHGGGGNIVGGWTSTDPHVDFIVPHPFEIELKRIARERLDLRWIMHNSQFDLKFLSRLGIDLIGPLEDTMVNAALLNEYQGSYSLSACCQAMKVQDKKGEQLYAHIRAGLGVGDEGPKTMAHFWRLAGDDPLAVDYATGDGTSTWQLWEAQRRLLHAEELDKVHVVECRVIKVLHRMTWRGVRIDERQLERVHAWTKTRHEQAEQALPKNFNVRSGPQMLRLFTDSGAEGWPTTGKGNPSFTEKWLQTNDLGRKVVAVRKFSHLDQSFLTPLIERHIWKGRVHAEYNQTRSDDFGTITGRLSSSNPNLQQVPKRNKEMGSIFRSIFVPDEGKVWGSVDYSQCEPRLLAYYSQCKVLLDGYRAVPSVDAHAAVAKATGIDRERGKRINQTLLTGGGTKKIAAELGIVLAEAQALMDDYFERMPEIRELQRRAARRMEERSYVRSLLGRKARLDDRRYSYRAVNRLLQCGNADVIKLKMCEIDEELAKWEGKYDCHLLNNVHDSLDYQYARDEGAVALYEWAKKQMVDFGPGGLIEMDVPFEVDAGEGRSWSEATYGTDALEYLMEVA